MGAVDNHVNIAAIERRIEILTMLRDKLYKCFELDNRNPFAMCVWLNHFVRTDLITPEEYRSILRYLKDCAMGFDHWYDFQNTPVKVGYDDDIAYYFPKGDVAARIEWLNEHIKINQDILDGYHKRQHKDIKPKLKNRVNISIRYDELSVLISLMLVLLYLFAKIVYHDAREDAYLECMQGTDAVIEQIQKMP